MVTRVYRAKNSAGYDCVVTEWYRKLAKTEWFDIIKQYDTLESYMQDLATDIAEMIKDASLSEKQLLQKKISSLATKVEQLNA